MYFVGTIDDMYDTPMCPHRSQRKILADASTTEKLNGAINHVGMHLGCHNLNHGNLVLGSFFPYRVNHPGGFECQQTRLLDLQLRLGNPVLDDTLLGQWFAESYTRSGSFTHELQSILRSSYRAHT